MNAAGLFLSKRERRPSLLSDELVRGLVATGRVDVVVGVPTLDNAETVGHVVRAVNAAFAGPLARLRTVLLASDGGSRDGTPEIVKGIAHASGELLVETHTLRTVHRLAAPYHGLPGRGNALRILFASASLLGAEAVAVVDPDDPDLTAESLSRLIQSIVRERFEFVKPAFARSPWEAPLVSQFVRPVMRAAFGRRLLEPIATQFACSGRFAAATLDADVWDQSFAQHGIDTWLSARAMMSETKLAQVPMVGRAERQGTARPALKDVFDQVADAVVHCLEIAPLGWLEASGSTDVPMVGDAIAPSSARPSFDRERYKAVFVQGVKDLEPILEPLLTSDTLAKWQREAVSNEPRIDDALWIRTIYETLAGAHHRVMPRVQLVQAMLPLYLGRLASFLAETESMSEAEVSARLEGLALLFEELKPTLASLWRTRNAR